MIDQILIQEGLLLISAEPKTGKSMVSLDLAISIASEKPFFNYYKTNRSGSVLFYNAEDQESVTRERCLSLCRANNIDPDHIDINFISPSSDIMLDSPEGLNRLRQAIQETKPDIVILDCFIRLHQIDENNSKQVASVLQKLKDIRNEFGSAICLVHHNRKSGSSGRSASRIRGSSEMLAFFDAAIILNKDINGDIKMSVEHKAAQCIQDVAIRLTNEDGEICPHLQSEKSSALVSVSKPSNEDVVRMAVKSGVTPIAFESLATTVGLSGHELRDILYKLIKSKFIRHTPHGYH
ncbi:MAG: AAA family ATPase, partial [Bdellovibrionales bacterium]